MRRARRGDSLGEIEAGFLTEVDVDENGVRLQLGDERQRVPTGRRDTQDGSSLALQNIARRVEEKTVVIDDDDT
jgi:hypothetical protein